MTRAEGKRGHTWLTQVVHIGDPDITSPASLVLLAKKYYTLDKSIFSEWRMNRIRRRWIKRLMNTPDELGGLTCAICGRKGLLPYDPSQYHKNQATLDHIIEICNGGSWRDESNFQVACFRCNNTKDTIRQRKKTLDIL